MDSKMLAEEEEKERKKEKEKKIIRKTVKNFVDIFFYQIQERENISL